MPGSKETPIWVNGTLYRSCFLARMAVHGNGTRSKEFTDCLHTGKLFLNKYYLSYRAPRCPIEIDKLLENKHSFLLSPDHCVHRLGVYRD